MNWCNGYQWHEFNCQNTYILELRINKSDQTEINNGGLIGLEGIVVVKVPIISDCPLITSHITWLNSNGLLIRDKSIALDSLYNYLITSILPVSGVKHYGEYRMLYDGNLITTITIKEKGKIFLYLLHFNPFTNRACCRVACGYTNRTWMESTLQWRNGRRSPTRLVPCTRSMGGRAGGLWSS